MGCGIELGDYENVADENKGKVQIKITDETEAGCYVNAISVHVNQNEVIMDLGYVLPNSNPTTIKVVNRANMSHNTAESFMNVLSNAMLDWRNKNKNSGSQACCIQWDKDHNCQWNESRGIK